MLGGNIFEIISAYLVGAILVAFTAWRLFESQTLYYTDIVLFVGALVSQVIYSIVFPFILREHRWRLYKQVGGDPILNSMAILKNLLFLVSHT